MGKLKLSYVNYLIKHNTNAVFTIQQMLTASTASKKREGQRNDKKHGEIKWMIEDTGDRGMNELRK
jgi:hypothetical protein